MDLQWGTHVRCEGPGVPCCPWLGVLPACLSLPHSVILWALPAWSPYASPSGGIQRGVTDPDTKVLLALLG